MPKFEFTVVVETDSEEHARQVLAERIGHDEDYGFDYRIDYRSSSDGE